jgi:hypothetical protein
MRTAISTLGAIVSGAISAIGISFNAFNICPSIEWIWIAGISFFIFVIIIWQGWSASENRAKQYEKTNPYLIFKEKRESEIWQPGNNDPIFRALQVWFINKPKISSERSVAKDLTATVTFYNRVTKKNFDVYGIFVVAEYYEDMGYRGISNKIDKFPPSNEPAKLQLAIKRQNEESAHAFVKNVSEPEILMGSHYVRVQFSGTGINQKAYWFNLTNPGNAGTLSISNPIKPPNLHREGFLT